MIKVIFGMAVTLLAVALSPSVWARSVCLSRLNREVEKISRNTQLGVMAQTVGDNPQILINRHGDRAFIPASNQKLLTSAIALHYLGADRRIATSLITELPIEDGEIKGNLWIIGRGDPTLTTHQGIRALVTQLKDQGVHSIGGDIKLLSALNASELARGWQNLALHEYYAAPASAFTLDENSHYWTVTPTRRGQPPRFTWDAPDLAQGWRVDNQAVTTGRNGSYTLYTERPHGQKLLRLRGTIPENTEPELGGVAIPDQQAYFRTRMIAELTAQNITVRQQAVAGLGAARVELAQWLSPPLAEMLVNINKSSNNLHAEQILRILGNTLQPQSTDAYLAGIRQIQIFFGDQRMPRAGLVVADGSGLSRYNLVSPRMLVLILQFMAQNNDFRNSLAIAGVDGTLKKRFRNTIAVNRLRAKTGTITGAVALSGYIANPDFREIAFSIMINNSNQSTGESRRVIDAIALLLMGLQKC